MAKPPRLTLAHLYPKLMNIYGDRGNILCLERRCRERSIGFRADAISIGDKLRAGEYDMVFLGGAQDSEQRRVAEDLRSNKAGPLREAAEHGAVILAVCGGYQLMGRFYRPASGEELPGAGLLDLWTVHPGPRAKRFIGNVVARWKGRTLVGFENHGGRTFLGQGAQPLAEVITGYGNNGEDGTEGAVCGAIYGTYLHGSLLPKNPAFADHLIETALRRKHKDITLDALDDRIEKAAHAAAVRLATRRGIIG
jgi:CobQ-like glutamine amidotransferase family enzyme